MLTCNAMQHYLFKKLNFILIISNQNEDIYDKNSNYISNDIDH